MNLTPRQLETLRIIRDYIAAAGCAPTLDEIAVRRGVTKVTVFEQLKVLRGKSLLRRSAKRRTNRNLELAPAGEAALAAIISRCPHCGGALNSPTPDKEVPIDQPAAAT